MKAQKRWDKVTVELTEIFNLAREGEAYDFSKREVLEKLKATDQRDARCKVRARNDELEALLKEFEKGTTC